MTIIALVSFITSFICILISFLVSGEPAKFDKLINILVPTGVILLMLATFIFIEGGL